MLSIKDYGSDNAIGLNAGILWRAMRGIQLGLYMNNINSPTISKENESLPRIISGGISFVPVRGLTLAGDLYKDFDHDLQIRVGQELRIIKYLAIRGGVQTKPSRFTAGAGFYVMNLALDYAFFSHSTLGASHNVSLTIRFGEREDDHIFDYESAMKPHTKKGKKKSEDLKPGEKIDINTATIEDFMRVPGIGPSTAKAIVEYREQKGGFKDVKEIMKVKRIGSKSFDKMKDYLMITP
jgi:comEA protein